MATFFFLRGHNAPGGGFVAGLVMSVGLLLQYIVSGTEWVEERVRLAPRALIGVGCCWSSARPSGRSWSAIRCSPRTPCTCEIPVLGELHVGSAMFFDLGVFCLVLGSTLLILIALAHQSIRAGRLKGRK